MRMATIIDNTLREDLIDEDFLRVNAPTIPYTLKKIYKNLSEP